VIEARLSVGVVCSVGVGPERGGRASNQDNYLVCRDAELRWREGDAEAVTPVGDVTGVLLAVADGMGGHEDGELASASAVQALARLYGPPPQDPETALHSFLVEGHRAIRARVADSGEVKMGTTLCAAWVIAGRAWWVHVGDSRVYLYRHGRMTRITRDHTREEFALRDSRSLPPHPRFLAQNFIYGSRGLGNDAHIRIDRGLDTGSFALQRDDRVLLCTDGLHGFVDDSGIAEVLQAVPEPAAASVALLERAIARGSQDNVTAIVVRVDGVDKALDGREETIVPV
jgi:protein phosphatase